MALTSVLLCQVFCSLSRLPTVVFVCCADSRHGNTHTRTHTSSPYLPRPPSSSCSFHSLLLTGPSPSPCGTKLIEDDWFFPGCSDSALETRQQELEEELAQAQVQGLGRHRAKKSAPPSQRSLQVNALCSASCRRAVNARSADDRRHCAEAVWLLRATAEAGVLAQGLRLASSQHQIEESVSRYLDDLVHITVEFSSTLHVAAFYRRFSPEQLRTLSTI